MECSSVVRAVIGIFACCGLTVLCHGCNTPGTVGDGAGRAGGGGNNINLGLGGQSGVRAWGNGGSVTDAAKVVDAVVARKDARTEGAAPDVQGAPSARPDARQVVDQAALSIDVRQAVDQTVTRDVPAKEVAAREASAVIDVGSRVDVGAPEAPRPVIDALALDAPAVVDVAAAECRHGGVTYAVGDSFPNDCNTCFCVAGGDIVCTVKPCSLDAGAR